MITAKLHPDTSRELRSNIFEFVNSHDTAVSTGEIANHVDPNGELPKTSIKTQIKNLCNSGHIYLTEDRGRGGRWYKAGTRQHTPYVIETDTDGNATLTFPAVHAPQVVALLASLS